METRRMTRTAAELVHAARSRIREIDADTLARLAAEGVPVIDVREPAEYAAGHVPGAVNIPRGLVEFEVDGHPAVNCARDPALAHRERPVIVYCRTGGRSALTADALRILGFREPLSLAGGLVAWSAAGRALTAPAS
jgi:rhodanese-related sulfurtransferase